MSGEVEVTDEFKSWWGELSVQEQRDVTRVVEALEEHGTNLPKQHSASVLSSRHGHMRELGSRAAADRSGSSMRSTHVGRPSC